RPAAGETATEMAERIVEKAVHFTLQGQERIFFLHDIRGRVALVARPGKQITDTHLGLLSRFSRKKPAEARKFLKGSYRGDVLARRLSARKSCIGSPCGTRQYCCADRHNALRQIKYNRVPCAFSGAKSCRPPAIRKNRCVLSLFLAMLVSAR